MYVTRSKIAALVIAVGATSVHFATGHADSIMTTPLLFLMVFGVIYVWFPEGAAALRRFWGFFRVARREPTPESMTVLGWVFIGLGCFSLVLALAGGV